jgi:hypothetical protein
MNDTSRLSFKLIRFNPRRAIRTGAAEVELDDGDNVFRLWMTLKEIERNIAEYGPHPGLLAAKEAYRKWVEVREDQQP